MDFRILDSSSEDDEMDYELMEVYETLFPPRRPYTLRLRIDHIHFWDDREFVVRFRLDKEACLYVHSLIETKIRRGKKNAIQTIERLLLALRFYASGCMLVAAGDFAGVSKTSACVIVKEVSLALASLGPMFIRMPSTEEERRKEQLKFFKKAKLPRIIGAIDCTHVRMQSPGGSNAESFRNRKGYFSLNVQTVSSADLKILDIVARWQGSSHDQTIFNHSRLKSRLESGEFGNSIIVADCGYANTRYVMTPFVRATTAAEQLYNEAVIRTRNPVERSYGVWKRRFPVIAYGMRLKVKNVQAVILATAVLHNIAINRNLPQPPLNEDVERAININDFDCTPVQTMDNVLTARDAILEIFK